MGGSAWQTNTIGFMPNIHEENGNEWIKNIATAQITSRLCIPFTSEGLVDGIIDLYCAKERHLTEYELTQLKDFMELVGECLTIQGRADRGVVTNRTNHIAVGLRADLYDMTFQSEADLITYAQRLIGEGLGYEYGVYWTYDEEFEGRHISFMSSLQWGPKASAFEHIDTNVILPAHETWFHEAVRDRKTMFRPYAGVTECARDELALSLGFRQMIAIPIITAEGPVGVL